MASSRSLAEVADLERALCLLIKRSSDISDAKAAELRAQMHSLLHTDPSKPQDGSVHPSDPPGNHAEYAGADISKLEGEDVGVSGSGVTASSELVTPEVEELLPSAARRVSMLVARSTFTTNFPTACPVWSATDFIQVAMSVSFWNVRADNRLPCVGGNSI